MREPIVHHRRWALFVALAIVVALHASPARAATFTITITNSSNSPWSQGLLTLQPLIAIGASPRPPSTQYNATYLFVDGDSSCTALCPTCLGNATVLAQRWGLTIGTSAWVVPALAVNASTTVTFTATAGQRVSYVSRITSGTDDMIALHAVGSLTDLTAPLFGANGLPLDSVPFDIAGYDVNTTNKDDGNAPSCSPACAPAATGCFTAQGNGTSGGQFTSQPAQSTFGAVWKYNAGSYLTDGISLGDVTGTAGNELVVTCEGAPASGAPVGRVVVLDRGGTVDSTFDDPSGNDLMGFSMIEDLDLAGKSEYLVNEFAPGLPTPGGAAYARRGTSVTSMWTSTGYGWAGFWNMGPSAGDVRSDNAGNEVVEADYDGDVLVLKRDTAASLNTYDTFTAPGVAEHVSGHAAIADVAATAGNEIVLFGANSGKVLVLSAPLAGGSLNLVWSSTGLPAGAGPALGSGPAIADIDGDGNPEIIVASSTTGAVYAYDTRFGTGCKYKWSATGGAGYSFTSPVVGDVNGDGKPDVVVFSSDSVLSVLSAGTSVAGSCVESTLEWKYTVGNGGAAWFTPALGNLTGSGALDVVVANYNTLEVINVAAKQLALRYSDATATFYPSVVVEHGAAGAAGASLYVSGWQNGNVYRFDTQVNAPVPADWPTFMGSNTRTGAR